MRTQAKYDAMAGVLSEIGLEVEALGEVLCRDPAFAARHVRELQAIDLIAQKQRALAAILVSGMCEQEMGKITIDSLRSRFCGFLDEGTDACPVEDVDPGDAGYLSFWGD
ncbi:hypothetical protein B2G71_10885 [Novosphingobium sp. PC22D]|uniref:hypothetical protein n=1 Tax=Novosphingobium sp. PC22D TaxID=1962403 RepID=UPI000BFAF5B8|nr:hypothetical protein [Novosphingobium sp. PC22D]PEQ12790.1 hypothetical protein B2G71_10885 [Novosphingobium sp. PC22D]